MMREVFRCVHGPDLELSHVLGESGQTLASIRLRVRDQGTRQRQCAVEVIFDKLQMPTRGPEQRCRMRGRVIATFIILRYATELQLAYPIPTLRNGEGGIALQVRAKGSLIEFRVGQLQWLRGPTAQST